MNTGTQKIPASTGPFKIAIVALLAFSILLATAYFNTEPQPYKWTFFIGASIFVCFFWYACLSYIFRPDNFALVLDETGITEQTLLGARSIKWVDIERFGLCSVDGGNVVAMKFRSRKWFRIFFFGKYDATLLNKYKIENRDLLAILQRWHELQLPEKRGITKR